MKQITIEKPDAIRIEPGAQDGFVEVVIISNISPLPVIREDEQESTPTIVSFTVGYSF